MRHPDGRAGFTLVEILVAMVIASMAMLAARSLVEELGDGAARIVRHARDSDEEANAEHLLRELAHRLEVGTDDSSRFAGRERIARFTSWCEVARGWLERCRVTLAVDTHGRQPVLAASLSTGEVLVLRRDFALAELRYLADAGGGGRWFRTWEEGVTAPLAIGVIVGLDTLILRIGERG